VAGPTVRLHTSGGADAASTTAAGLAVLNGEAVYAVVFEDSTTEKVTSVTDSVPGSPNTYTKVASYLTANGSISLWVADNVVGNAALAVTIHLSATTLFSYVILDITGQATPSFDKNGPGTNGVYVSGTSESDALAPKSATDLLLLLGQFMATQTGSGTPSITLGAEAGETLVDSFSESLLAAKTTVAGGVYSQPATTTASTSMTGVATVTGGVGLAPVYAVVMVGVLPFVPAPPPPTPVVTKQSGGAGPTGGGEWYLGRTPKLCATLRPLTPAEQLLCQDLLELPPSHVSHKVGTLEWIPFVRVTGPEDVEEALALTHTYEAALAEPPEAEGTPGWVWGLVGFALGAAVLGGLVYAYYRGLRRGVRAPLEIGKKVLDVVLSGPRTPDA